MSGAVWAEAPDDDRDEPAETEAHGQIDETLASRRLKRWLKGSGLSVERQRDLAPAASGAPDKLTVSLWVATKPATPREKRKRTVEYAA